jgi:diguanylate cyclase (GGDEF)-like protein
MLSADLHTLQTRKNVGKAKGLLHSLVPRAQCFCFYGSDRQCVWSSDGADDYEVDNFVVDLPGELIDEASGDAEAIRRTLNSGRTLLVLPVFDDTENRLGLLVAVFSRNAGKSSSFNPKMLVNILRPAVDLIGESLVLGQNLQAAARQSELIENELTLVYEVDEKIHSTSRSHSGLAQLVGQSGRFLSIAYSVLLIPSKRIRVSATHSSWKSVNRKVLDRYLIDHLLPKLEGKRWPAVFEIPGIDGADNTPDKGYQTLLCPILDKHGNLEGVLAQLGRINDEDFSKSDRRFMAHIVRKVEYVIEQSFDAMTGLMNRSGFEAQLQESAKTLSNGDDTHQLIYLDLDNLQLVNDTFNRDAGDAVIVHFARLLEEDLSRHAVVSRLTGDDFCILLTNSDTDKAMQLAQSIRERGQSLRYLEGDKSLQVTMSIGIAEFNAEIDGGRALTTARMACEAAKEHGRDRIEIYDDQNLSIIRRHDDMQLVTRIQQALDGDEFELYAQPIASLSGVDERPRFEVLLRMKDESGEQIPTSSFFSAAERYKLMPQIDRWVISNTMAKLSNESGTLALDKTIFSINLSGQSLSDDDILEFIEDELENCGLPPELIGFEVTESAAVSNLKKAQAFIDALRSRGCMISLDDFGAGLSSFAYLKNFNVDTLKIDGGFIRDITDNRISESMVAAITQVAKVMELDTVAEYVESEETRQLISDLGVDFAQGHIVGRPIPLGDTLQQLQDDLKTSTA